MAHSALRAWFSSLTTLQRIALALVVLAALNLVAQSALGSPRLSGHAGNFVIVVLLFGLTRLRLWRVRNRLLLSYFLFGVVPLALVTVLVSLTANTLFGLIAADSVRRGLDDRTNALVYAATELAAAASGERSLDPPAWSRFVRDLRAGAPGMRAIVVTRNGPLTIPPDAAIRTIPSWSKPNWAGLFESDGRYFIGAHARTRPPAGDPLDAFTFVPLEGHSLRTIAPAVRALALVALDAEDDINTSLGPGRSVVSIDSGGVRRAFEYLEATGLPPKQWAWDPELGWAVSRPVTRASGVTGRALVTFVSRPSLLLPLLADPSDLGLSMLAALTIIAGGFFLVVMAGSVIWSARLTRTITRSVHDLYEGTRQVAAGNLAHRTPVRGKDQLSELVSSFNGMTERVQQLIVEVGEKKKLESELEIARQVQTQQFPKSVPQLASLEVAALCIPSRFVSGDYYDYLSLDNGQLALALGDVSGKGISAALVMASLQSALHAQLKYTRPAAAQGPSPSTATLMARISEQLYENTPPEKYATFFCSTYDDRTGTLLYTNAGHLPPILVRGHEAIRLDVGGTVVGLMPIYTYEQRTVVLQSGDLLAMFTDGITEAEDASGEQFGDERLARLLVEHRGEPLEEIVRIVTTRVRDWAHDPGNQDDTTILLARRR